MKKFTHLLNVLIAAALLLAMVGVSGQQVGAAAALAASPAAPEKSTAPSLAQAITAQMPNPILQWLGLTRANNLNLADPDIFPQPPLTDPNEQTLIGAVPDTAGAAGYAHYLQAVNKMVALYKKDGTLFEMADIATLWTSAATSMPAPPATACTVPTAHHGQPSVAYDQLNQVYLIMDVAYENIDNGPYFLCIAVSKDKQPISVVMPPPALPWPAGTYFSNTNWFYYAVATNEGNLHYYPDMPKLGVWPDGYYLSANMYDISSNGLVRNFKGAKVWAVNDSDLVGGQVNTFRYFSRWIPTSMGYDNLVPGNLLGSPPPTGTPNYFASVEPTKLYIWEFKVNWNNLGASTFGKVSPSGEPNYALNADTGDLVSRVVVPQTGTDELVDAHGDRLMSPLQYRIVNGVASLWTSYAVRPDGDGTTVGLRWHEIQFAADGTPNIFQTGTHRPTDPRYRWLSSLAVDRAGNMAIGYSISEPAKECAICPPLYPSIAYAGRLRKDPAGQLPLTENFLYKGGGPQFDSPPPTDLDGPDGPWGRQSQMSIDPVDDCVFWYTNMYYPAVPITATNVISNSNWQTRIGFFTLKDCRGGGSARVSLSTSGIQGNYASGQEFEEWGRTVAISADGRYVAFSSEASNLVSNDSNGLRDIFIRDRDTDGDGIFDEPDAVKTGCITCQGLGGPGNGDSWEVSISSSGRYVAFMSLASNLVTGDTNGASDIFVYDRTNGLTIRASVRNGSVNANGTHGEARHPFISGDGRYVVFDANFIDLVNGDTNSTYDVFVRDLATNLTKRVSLYASSLVLPSYQLSYESITPSISEDGRYIAFASRDPLLSTNSSVPMADANLNPENLLAPAGTGLDVFLTDWALGTIVPVSYIPAGTAMGNQESYYPYIAAGGKQIAFASRATDLVSLPDVDNNGYGDIFVWDSNLIVPPATVPFVSRVSVNFFGAEAKNGESFYPSISADGRYVAFSSNATNLDAFLPDQNGKRDIFLHDRGDTSGGTFSIGPTQRVSLSEARSEANGSSVAAAIAPLGGHIAFASNATNLTGSDTNNTWDVFAYSTEVSIPTFLKIPGNVPGTVGSTVNVPVIFTGNGYNIDTLAFSIDYDETCLEFMNGATDVTFSLSSDFSKDWSFNAGNTNGELKVSIYDASPPRTNIPDGTLMTVKFKVKSACAAPPGGTTTTRVGFSITPAPSFGGFGQSIKGASQDGFVSISEGLPGDCNGDSVVNAGDLSGLVLEIFDGDGISPVQTPLGTFLGNPVGCNPNLDSVVDAGDLSCVVLKVWGGSCGTGMRSSADLQAPQAGISLALPSKMPIRPGMKVAVPVTLAKQGQTANSAIFSVDYDQSWLSFDPTDANQDGMPDAVSLRLPAGLSGTALFDPTDEDGELDLAVYPAANTALQIPDGVMAILTFTAEKNPGEFLAQVRMSDEPAPSFGSTAGQSLPTTAQGGSVWVSDLVKLLYLPLLHR